MGIITYKDYIIEPEGNTRFTLKKKRTSPPSKENKFLGRDFEELMGSSMSMSAAIAKIILDLTVEDMDDSVELAKFREDFIRVEREATNVLGKLKTK